MYQQLLVVYLSLLSIVLKQLDYELEIYIA